MPMMFRNNLLEENSPLYQLVLCPLYPKTHLNIGYVVSNRARPLLNNNFTEMITQENYTTAVYPEPSTAAAVQNTNRFRATREAAWQAFLEYSRRVNQEEVQRVEGRRFLSEEIIDAGMLSNLDRFENLKTWINTQPNSWAKKYYMATKIFSVIDPTVTRTTATGIARTSQASAPLGAIGTAAFTGDAPGFLNGLGDAHVRIQQEGEQNMNFVNQRFDDFLEGNVQQYQGPTHEGRIFAIEWAEIYSSTAWGLFGGLRNDEGRPEETESIALRREPAVFDRAEVEEEDGELIDVPDFTRLVVF